MVGFCCRFRRSGSRRSRCTCPSLSLRWVSTGPGGRPVVPAHGIWLQSVTLSPSSCRRTGRHHFQDEDLEVPNVLLELASFGATSPPTTSRVGPGCSRYGRCAWLSVIPPPPLRIDVLNGKLRRTPGDVPYPFDQLLARRVRLPFASEAGGWLRPRADPLAALVARDAMHCSGRLGLGRGWCRGRCRRRIRARVSWTMLTSYPGARETVSASRRRARGKSSLVATSANLTLNSLASQVLGPFLRRQTRSTGSTKS
jgi:hypothetical protein